MSPKKARLEEAVAVDIMARAAKHAVAQLGVGLRVALPLVLIVIPRVGFAS